MESRQVVASKERFTGQTAATRIETDVRPVFLKLKEARVAAASLENEVVERGGYTGSMSDVTHILNAVEQGDPHAASQLLPLVYEDDS
jgi:hypothetical protein